MSLEYFAFYQGNLAHGFTTIYGKKVADHAFIMTRKNDASLPILDIADASVDFSKKRQHIIKHDFKLRRFENDWQDVSFQWENIDRHLHELIQDWQFEYRTIKGGDTEEWGLRLWDNTQTHEQHFVGANEYPANYEHFVQWLTGLAKGRMR